jgi:hypothetical protein
MIGAIMFGVVVWLDVSFALLTQDPIHRAVQERYIARAINAGRIGFAPDLE